MSNKITRRGFLRFLGAGAASSLLVPITNAAEKTADGVETFLETGNITKTRYLTGSLKGRKLGGLFTDYTGIEGRVEATVEVDFKKQLNSLWERKKERTTNKVVRQTYDERVSKYLAPDFKPTQMGISEYLGHAKAAIKQAQDNINWKEVDSLKELDKKKGNLLMQISSSLTEKNILAYALTELMPSDVGEVNVEVMNFLLRSAGREYTELIPALYDNLTSFGPYQWTSHAVFDANGIKKGASIVNRALEDHKLPGSVIYLENDDHHKAAYLFAIDNIADLLRSLNGRQLKVLEDKWKTNSQSITGYIATAHHSPKNAIRIAHRWLDNEAKSDYQVSCNGRFIAYARKTKNNLKALEEITTTETKYVGSNQQTKKIQKEEKQVTQDAVNKTFYGRAPYNSPKGGEWASFKYQVKYEDLNQDPKIVAIRIASRFNEEDAKEGDNYKAIGYSNIKVDSPEGRHVVRDNVTLRAGDIVYLVAKRIK